MSKSATKFIKIRKLSIIIRTNRPGKEQNTPLTNKSFFFPTTKPVLSNDYPYIVINYRYNLRSIFERFPTHEDRIKLFFYSDKEFRERISDCLIRNETVLENELMCNNVMVTLRCLFTTSYPFPRYNIIDSLEYYFKNNRQGVFDFTIMLKNSINTWKQSITGISNADDAYTYINIDGQPYTVGRVIWLREIVNHPIYEQLLARFADLDEQFEKSKAQFQRGLDAKNNAFEKKIQGKAWSARFTDILEFYKKKGKTNDKEIDLINKNVSISGALRSAEQSKLTIKQEMKLKIDDMINELNAFNNTKKIVDLRKVIDQYEQNKSAQSVRTYGSENYILTNRTVDSFMEDLQRTIKEIRADEQFQAKYFGDEMNLSFETEDRQKLSENAFYSQFLKGLAEYTYPARRSTNPYLQLLLDNYSDKTDTVFKDFAEFLLENYVDPAGSINPGSPDPKIISGMTAAINKKSNGKSSSAALTVTTDPITFMDTGVSFLFKGRSSGGTDEKSEEQSETCEIYLHLDVLMGVLTEPLSSKIFCPYMKDKLATKILRKIKQGNYSKFKYEVGAFLEIENAVKSVEKKEKEIKTDQTEVAEPANKTQRARGGRRKRKRNRTRRI
jgi:hypothetical protein